MSARLYAMTCGWLTMSYDFFVRGEPGTVSVPIPAFLLKHPKGTAIFDTGLGLELQSNDKGVRRTVLGALADHVDVEFHPGEELTARMHDGGIDPSGVDYLINSHLHMDHCGGNAMIPNARWLIQRREWEAASIPEDQERFHYHSHQYDLGHDRIEIEGEHDVFGDGSVICIPTFGHTPGHQSLKVRLPDGDVVICSDACYMRKTLDQMHLPDPSVTSDAEQMLNTLRKFRALQDAGAQLIFGHDPEQWKQLNEGPLREITSAKQAAAQKAA